MLYDIGLVFGMAFAFADPPTENSFAICPKAIMILLAAGNPRFHHLVKGADVQLFVRWPTRKFPFLTSVASKRAPDAAKALPWGISNYMLFSGLVRYGFTTDALEMAEKTIRLMGRNLEINGCLHEYYHPDTCEPIVTHGFQNWNFLVLNMIAWMKGRRFMDTF